MHAVFLTNILNNLEQTKILIHNVVWVNPIRHNTFSSNSIRYAHIIPNKDNFVNTFAIPPKYDYHHYNGPSTIR